jgi:hypothetical protein
MYNLSSKILESIGSFLSNSSCRSRAFLFFVKREFSFLNNLRVLVSIVSMVAPTAMALSPTIVAGTVATVALASTLTTNSLRVSCLKLVEVFAMQHNIIRFCFFEL